MQSGYAKAVLFEHHDYMGYRTLIWDSGDYPDVTSVGFMDDALSSVQLADGCSLVVYELPNFLGRQASYSGNTINMEGFHDIVSSFKLSCGVSYPASTLRRFLNPRP
jgi:hypothetical protein